MAGPFGGDSITNLIVLCATVSTGVTLVGAFLLFGRRRRRADEPGEGELAPIRVAAAAWAAPTYAPAPPRLTPAPPGTPPAAHWPAPAAPTSHAPGPAAPSPVGSPAFDPGTGGTDVNLPRWRRPSLMAARKSDPIRTAPAAGSLTFAAGQAADGRERRLVRYRLVRLLDRPDEVAGTTVDTLDEGDEVEVLEKHGLYRRVTTPDGRSGWLHKMTLGDLVEAADPEPMIERDVLLAYLSGREKDG